MNRPPSPRMKASVVKRKRQTTDDFLDDPSSRPAVDSPNMSPLGNGSPQQFSQSQHKKYVDGPPHGPRGRQSEPGTIGKTRAREQERPPYMDDARSPEGRYSSGRDDRRERDRDRDKPAQSASTYRPDYSEKTRAMLYPSSKGPASRSSSNLLQAERPIATDEAHSAAVIEVTTIFAKLIDEATDLATLKMHQSTAENLLRRRTDEFTRSTSQHEKFPSLEESQRRAKDDATKVCKALNEKIRHRQSTLGELAKGAAAAVLPNVLPAQLGPSSADLQKLEAQYKALEKTCQDLKRQVEETKKFLDGERQQRLQLEKTQAATDLVRKEQSQAIENLQKDSALTLEKLEVGEKQSKSDVNITFQGVNQKLDHFAQLYSSLQSQFTKISDEAKDLRELEVRHTDLEERVNVITSQTNTQLNTLEGGVRDIEARVKSTLSSDLNRVHKQLETVEGRVKAAEMRPPTMSPPSTAPNESRLQSLENQMQHVPAQIEQVSADLARFKAQQEAADEFTGQEIDAAKICAKTTEGQLTQAQTAIRELEKSLAAQRAEQSASGQVDSTKPLANYLEQKINGNMSELSRRLFEIDQRFEARINGTISEVSNRLLDIDQRVEANTLGFVSLDTRYQALNTRDLAMHMVSALSESYPNIRDCQVQLVAFDKGMRAFDTRLQELDVTCKMLQSQVKIPEDQPQQVAAPPIQVPTSVENAKTSQSLRADIDTLTRSFAKEFSNLKAMIKEEASVLEAMIKELVDRLAALTQQVAREKAEIGEEFAVLHISIDDHKESEFADISAKVEDIASSLAHLESRLLKPVPPNASGTSMNTSIPKPPGGANTSSTATNKRRKLSSNGPAQRAATNGNVNGQTSGANAGRGVAPSLPSYLKRRPVLEAANANDPNEIDYDIPHPTLTSDGEN